MVVKEPSLDGFGSNTSSIVSVPLRGNGRESGAYFSSSWVVWDVSVPLRGNGRERDNLVSPLSIPRILVSVPLRGNGRERDAFSESGIDDSGKFQSPCGEMVVKESQTSAAAT